MTINIQVELDNAAFHNETEFNTQELTRCLGKIGTQIGYTPYGKLDKEGDHGKIVDYNGNVVGAWEIESNPDRR